MEVRTYKPIDKRKEFVGVLQAYDNGNITILMDDEERNFSKADVALVRLTFDF